MTEERTFESLINNMTVDVWESMRNSIAIGRWPDGRRLTDEQRALSLEAVIAWEIKNNIPEEERTGYLPAGCQSQLKQQENDNPVVQNAKELTVD